MGAAREKVPLLYGGDRTTLARHKFWHKFILSRLWEWESIDEIAVPWTCKTHNTNISPGFLLLTLTGRGLEPHDVGYLKRHLTTGSHMRPYSVYVWDGCKEQFEVSVSLNHDVMTSFWRLYKWSRTPKSVPQVGGYNCDRLILFYHGQHINVLKHFVHV